ncbi:MAG: hypothetical protein HOA57_03650 [Candidatus Magasanikbacteria bacterium]|jgi:hypothetical protein|nr:hypothetical protein [Candidatus Magasanikbacteria bacterium]MBT4314566.1 hypothetical protein [Candidatus Magasanikbacteria bacterium]MBT4547464.1 hypothetical protein [Candidatus Magasanikbacteria bacterium]MBT6819446.1 hypothetical protein [Candidatus Magasanikbacteria bacterium]
MKRNLISAGIALFSLICLWAINSFTFVWVFLPVCVVWIAVLTFFVYKAKVNFWDDLYLVVSTALAFLVLIALLEPIYLRYLLMVFACFVLFFLFMRILQKEEVLLSYEEKPYRRMLMMLWVFNGYALITFGFALSIFFPSLYFWIISFFVGVAMGYISIVVWKMYFNVPVQNFLLRAVLVTLIIWEVMWVIHLLPLGYFVLGGMVVWLWYLIQLFVRFHLSKRGIIWKRQIVFLISNLVLYFLILSLFVRWI